MSESFRVKRAAVLGAGVMGAQIAAHLANSGIEAMLFELPANGPDARANARKAIASLRKLEPAPLAQADLASTIRPATYESDLGELKHCELVIEAIAERPDWKFDLYAKVAPALGPDTVFASNTSGLSVNALAQGLPEPQRHRFCGMHFFNPPRYMGLVELIPSASTAPDLLNTLETFLTTALGKNVIRARDTPNFVANRIGVFSMLAVMHHGARFGLRFDTVDALTGPLIGRPKSATFRTADVVGLDTLAHVIDGSATALKDDPWRSHYAVPGWLQGLVDQGALGQKTRLGVYRKVGREIQVLVPGTGDYQPVDNQLSAAVSVSLKTKDFGARLQIWREASDPQARFLWAIHRDAYHYAAVLLDQIADNARDLDLAIRWGFGWQRGPMESWQAAGWRQLADWIREDIDNGETMADAALPDWVGEVEAVHLPQGSWSPKTGDYRPRSSLAVYRRQAFPDRVLGEQQPEPGRTLYENEGVRLWTPDDEIAVLGFRSKMHAIGGAVLDGIQESLAIAEGQYAALVFWHPTGPFSAGANLSEIVTSIDDGSLESVVKRFQGMTNRLRYSTVPVVAAAQGLALGGGCELLMHCDRVVAALETYIGLVEVGVGLLPAGGGCKELASRASAQSGGAGVFDAVKGHFDTVAMGRVARSALEARRMGLLRPVDVIIPHAGELLHVALAQARALAEIGYRPPLAPRVSVAGREGVANLELIMVNMHEGGFISDHDHLVGSRIAAALCGGDLDPGTEVTEDWLLGLERRAFLELAANERTQQRIAHMLKTGKPLRN